jgi:hypothetical protein
MVETMIETVMHRLRSNTLAGMCYGFGVSVLANQVGLVVGLVVIAVGVAIHTYDFWPTNKVAPKVFGSVGVLVGLVALGVIGHQLFGTHKAALTERLRTTKVDPHPLLSGVPVRANRWFINDGPETIEMQAHAKIIVVDDAPKDIADIRKLEDELWLAYVKPSEPMNKIRIPPRVDRWMTVEGSVLTDVQAAAFQRGSALLFFMGTDIWSDSTSRGKHDWCGFTKGDPRVIFNCEKHNGASPE